MATPTTAALIQGLWTPPRTHVTTHKEHKKHTNITISWEAFVNHLVDHVAPDPLSEPWLANAALNLAYAERHRHAYQLYLFRGTSKDAGCVHPHNGLVLAYYCRLPALLDAMTFRHPGRGLYLWLDNDAAVRSMAWPIDAFLRAAPITDQASAVPADWCKPIETHALDAASEQPATAHQADGGRRSGRSGGRGAVPSGVGGGAFGRPPALMLWSNTAFGCRGTSGVIAVRGGDEGVDILREWWSYAGEPLCSSASEEQRRRGWCAQHWSDQGSLNEHIATPAALASRRVVVLADESMRLLGHGKQFILHRCGACHFLPPTTALWAAIAAENGISNASLAAAAQRVLDVVAFL